MTAIRTDHSQTQMPESEGSPLALLLLLVANSMGGGEALRRNFDARQTSVNSNIPLWKQRVSRAKAPSQSTI